MHQVGSHTFSFHVTQKRVTNNNIETLMMKPGTIFKCHKQVFYRFCIFKAINAFTIIFFMKGTWGNCYVRIGSDPPGWNKVHKHYMG